MKKPWDTRKICRHAMRYHDAVGFVHELAFYGPLFEQNEVAPFATRDDVLISIREYDGSPFLGPFWPRCVDPCEPRRIGETYMDVFGLSQGSHHEQDYQRNYY